MQLHAYFAPIADVAALHEWAAGKDWFGKWMPDFPERHNVLLGSHPDHPDWAAAAGTVDWWDPRASKPPADLLQCAVWYGGTGTSRDASGEEETRGYVPTRPLLDALGLSRGVDFVWNDASGVAAHDPSVRLGGPATLAIRRDVVPRLADAGLTVFWTVLVGQEVHRSDHMSPDDDYRWISASASYILVEGDRIEQIDAGAVRRAPGPIDEQVLDWVTKSAES